MDPAEEQAAELEALEAIFAGEFRILQHANNKTCARFEIELADDVSETVKIRLVIAHTQNYPQEPPMLVLHALEGLSTSRRKELQSHLEAAAADYAEDHMASAFSLCEVAKEWIATHVVGHAQDDEDEQRGNDTKFETLDATQEDKVEVISSKAMGTPVTLESFMVWREKFLEELESSKSAEQVRKETNTKMTGREFFESKTVVVTAESESFWENEAMFYEENA
ncbi:Ubiquitin-conjugating enzyme/RWD-like protein [Gracilaria domingensis]|nr:Ubiquitin-conjugating enzyme/RWD-like protein [Gracilaria domingensis]